MAEIRIGLIRFVGQEALRSQRWAITCLIAARALFWLSVTALLWLNALKSEPRRLWTEPRHTVLRLPLPASETPAARPTNTCRAGRADVALELWPPPLRLASHWYCCLRA